MTVILRTRRVCALGEKQDVTKDDMEIVSALQEVLADKVGKERFELWFGANTQLRLAEGTLTVSSPTKFVQSWLQANFRRHLEDSCIQVLGRQVPVVFKVDEGPTLAEGDRSGDTETESVENEVASPDETASTVTTVAASRSSFRLVPISNFATSANSDRTGAATASAQSPGSAGKREIQNRDLQRRRFARFESFVIGAGNRVAHVAAQSAVERPGSASPLFIYGPTGVGKTHLLESIWSATRHAPRGAPAVYLSAEQFTTLFLEALHGGSGLPSFRRKYRGVGMLLIDDIQFFAGKKATVTELLHTIDTLSREGRQLVLAADRAPAELTDLGPELINRLQGGLVCRIESPDYETRLGIVRQMSVQLNVQAPEEVCVFVASHLTNNARELAGALKRLHVTSLAHQRPVSMSMAEDALSEMIRHGARSVRLPDIERAVCQIFGLEPDSLQSQRKGKHVSHPRMLAMWLARKHTRSALAEIGHYFGRRSHSTVISAQKKVDTWMSGPSGPRLSDAHLKIEDAIRRVEECLMVG